MPDRALLLDWVFADGPPQSAMVYDNNHRQDFHAIVPMSIPEELFWVEEEHQMYRKLQEERQLREQAMHAKVSLLFTFKGLDYTLNVKKNSDRACCCWPFATEKRKRKGTVLWGLLVTWNSPCYFLGFVEWIFCL